jgi:hypothetical protein
VEGKGLAQMMLDLQARGAINLNLVTGSHFLPQILEALPLAIEGGLHLPLVYNCGGYESLQALRLLDRVIDIYLPDAKYGEANLARLYSRAPDYVEVNRRALREMEAVKVLWTYDSVGRYPGQDDVSEVMDQVFYMDGGDVRESRDHWLPLGFDDQLYRPSGEDPWYDVLFVGKLGRSYGLRRRYIGELGKCRGLRRYRVAAIGTTGQRLGDFIFRLGNPINWVAGRLPPAEYARHIAHTKICINVHQDDGAKPVNPTFFAIPGTGVCQVAENREYLAKWLEPGREYIAFNPADLCECVMELLENDTRRASVAESGYLRAVADHTFKSRVRYILERSGLGQPGGSGEKMPSKGGG